MKSNYGWGVNEVKVEVQNEKLIACSAVLGFVVYLGILIKVYLF